MHYVYSTHTNSVNYVEFEKNTNRNYNIIKRSFTIAGGHGLCTKNLVTPQGVLTIVHKDEDMEWLLSLPSFQKDIKNGYIRHSKRKEETEKVVRKDMRLKDGSAPKTPSDYKVRDPASRSYATSNAMSPTL